MKPGDYAHNGYSRIKIIKESPLKGYAWIIQFVPTFKDCYGAQRLSGQYRHVSYRASLEFKKVE